MTSQIKIISIKTLVTFTFVLFSINIGLAQSGGIEFQNNLNWSQIKQLAKAQHKYIFVDCYASWCGPCKFMAQNVFPLKDVGDYINSKFISASVQMDRTPHDRGSVRRWYHDAETFHKKYSVFAYPTFLFFDADGKVVHRIEGSVSNGRDFIKKVSEVFEPQKRYYELHKNDLQFLGKHKSDSAYVRNFIDTALGRYEYENAALALEDYFSVINTPLSTENLKMVERVLHFAQSKKGLQFLLNNEVQIKKIDGNDWVDFLIQNRISEDYVKPEVTDGARKPDWSALSAKFAKKFGVFGKKSVAVQKAAYFYERGLFFDYAIAVMDLMKAYPEVISGYTINGFCWQMFQSCDDRKTLLAAALLSKKLVDSEIISGKVDPNDMDTFANLQYKLSNSADAIVWETIALHFATVNSDAKNTKSITEVLNKMKKGVKTWEQ